MDLTQWLTPGKDPSHATGLDPRFAAQLNDFLSAAPGDISIYSGYRSVKRQGELWQGALKKYGSPAAARKWVAPPGHSRHNSGLAADLTYGAGMESWAHENAAKYGLRFRMGHEDWHIEPTWAGNPTKPQAISQAAPVEQASAALPQQPVGDPLAHAGMFNRLTDANPMVRQTAEREMTPYNGNQFMADLIAGQNPFRRVVLGALFGSNMSSMG